MARTCRGRPGARRTAVAGTGIAQPRRARAGRNTGTGLPPQLRTRGSDARIETPAWRGRPDRASGHVCGAGTFPGARSAARTIRRTGPQAWRASAGTGAGPETPAPALPRTGARGTGRHRGVCRGTGCRTGSVARRAGSRRSAVTAHSALPDESPAFDTTEQPLGRARGLAELAFGSFSRVSGFSQGRHLALLPAETLELDLNDPAQRQFGDYELLEILGEGGMGVVYRARQNSLDREVAMKLLSAGPWASKDFIARFEREAQNAARMQHPNIVTVYEVGNSEGLHYFSMRLVRGESLSSRMKRGEKFTPRAAAALMRTVAEAVDYAHNLGVLHLDLKPANVLLDEAGTPYVADFGLARRLENTLAIENDEVSGTPAYMAPEQAQVRASKLTR